MGLHLSSRVRVLAAVAVVIAATAVPAYGASAASTRSTVNYPAPASCKNPDAGKGKGKKIVYIESATGNPFYDQNAIGFKKAAAVYGFDVSVVGPDTPGATTQIPYIQAAITNHVDGIAIQVNDANALLPLLKQAKAAGIKVFSLNITIDKTKVIGSISGVDFASLAAPSQLDELGRLMNWTGDFAILDATTTAPFQKMVVGQMLKLLKSDPKYKNMHLVAHVYGQDVAAKDTEATNALLARYPKLKGITAPTSIGIAAAAAVIDSVGKKGKIILNGLGDPNEMRKYVKNGTVKEFQLWDPQTPGVVAGAMLINEMIGKPFKQGSSVNIPCYGTVHSSAADGAVYAQNELTTFNAANIDKYQF